MSYEISEIYIQSIMTKTPTIIVEGIFDLQIYDNIFNKNSNCAEIIAIEIINGYSSGSREVIRAMDEIYQLQHSNTDKSNFICGIIDKDVRDFRNEIPENELIFVLKEYSIESHFVHPETAKEIIRLSTRSTSNLLTNDLINNIMSKIESSFDLLYLASIDSLMKAIKEDYASDFSYSLNIGRLKDEQIKNKLIQKSNELNTYANELGISFTIETLKKISKGKWILFCFCESLKKEIEKLRILCAENQITPCQYNKNPNDNEHNCLYTQTDISLPTIQLHAIKTTEISSLNYIKDRVLQMKTICANT